VIGDRDQSRGGRDHRLRSLICQVLQDYRIVVGPHEFRATPQKISTLHKFILMRWPCRS